MDLGLIIILNLGIIVLIAVSIINCRAYHRRYGLFTDYSFKKYKKADAKRFDEKCEEWKKNHPEIEKLLPLSNLPHRLYDRKLEEIEHDMEIRRELSEKYPEYTVIRIVNGRVIANWGTFQREDNLYSIDVYEIIAHMKNIEGQTKNLIYHAFARHLCIP